MYSIAAVCDAWSGIRSVIFSDMTNLANFGPEYMPPAPNTAPSFIDSDLLYSLAFERYSGVASRESVADQGGDSARYQVSIFVPKSRSEVDILLQRWRNRLLHVIAIDRYGSQHILYDAIASWTHTTGTRPGTRHGYQITFTAPSHYVLPAIAGSGELETAPPVGGGGSDPGSGDCCISIQPTTIVYTPAPTGNALNRNELVTTSSGTVYFIDSTGRSIILNRAAWRYYAEQIPAGTPPTSVVIPLEYPLPDPDDYAAPTYDPQAEISRRIFVKLASRWLAYDHAEGFTIDYATREVIFNTSIEEAYLEFYFHPDIPAIPL